MIGKRPLFVASLALVVALTLVSGVLEGRIRNRWGPTETMLAAAQKLGDAPSKFGGPRGDQWQLKSSDKMSDEALEMLECTGYFVRTYENARTGAAVNVFVIVGPAGPIAVHTPEICFSSQNYSSRGEREKVDLPAAQGHDDQFWALTFKTKTVQEDLLRVYYGWGVGGHWSAPNDARFAFTGSPYLYKIQASTSLPAGTDLKTGDTCREFMQDFVPALRKCLVESSRR